MPAGLIQFGSWPFLRFAVQEALTPGTKELLAVRCAGRDRVSLWGATRTTRRASRTQERGALRIHHPRDM